MEPTSQRTVTEQDQEISLHEIVDILYRRRKIIAATMIIIVFFTVLFMLSAKNIYESNVKLLIDQSAEGNFSIPSGLTMLMGASSLMGNKSLDTEIEIIKSRPIIEKVIRKFDKVNKKGEYVLPEGYAKKNLTVESIKGTNIISIAVHDKDPDTAKAIAEEITRLYIIQDTESRSNTANIAKTFVEDHLQTIKADLDRAEDAIKKFKEKNETVEIKTEAEERIKLVAELQSNMLKSQAAQMDAAAKLREVERQLAQQDPNFESSVTMINNPQMENLKSNLVNLETQKTKLMQEYGDQHPDIIAVKSQIEAIRDKMEREVKLVVGSKVESANPIYQNLFGKYVEFQSTLYGLEATTQALKGLIDEQRLDMSKLPAKEQELAQLMRNKLSLEKTYMFLLDKYQEYQIKEASGISQARIIEPANLPIKHIKPRRTLGVIISLFLSTFLGACLALGLEYFDDKVKTSQEVEEGLGTRMLGTTPQLSRNDIDSLAIKDTITPLYEESLRNIRSKINLLSGKNKIKTFLITGASRGVGKTFLTLQLAKVYAKTGAKVLAIDGDMRNSKIYEMLDLPADKGLSNYLTGQVKDENDIIFSAGMKNLSIIPAGSSSANPADLLESEKFGELLNKLKQTYDLVFIDTPPVPEVSDAVTVATQADGIIISARYDYSQKSALQETIGIINNTNTTILGLVLNNYPVTVNKQK
jgi:polysaccharide biosynthesis transport protein